MIKMKKISLKIPEIQMIIFQNLNKHVHKNIRLNLMKKIMKLIQRKLH